MLFNYDCILLNEIYIKGNYTFNQEKCVCPRNASSLDTIHISCTKPTLQHTLEIPQIWLQNTNIIPPSDASRSA